jgi:glycosyltransferase involved in cell wall biosynthesis
LRIAIWSHSASARAGGGVVYVWGSAQALAANHEVDLYCRPSMDPASLSHVLPDFGGGKPRIHVDPCAGRTRRRGELCRAWYDRGYDHVIVQSTRVQRFCLGRRRTLLCEFPIPRPLTLPERIRLARFDQVVANSHYTSSWIGCRWNRQAAVLHPPVVPIPACDKQPIILGVGRFTGGGRSKRQLDLVQTFKRLTEYEETEGWSLHLAGFPSDPAYVARVRAEAEGLAVTLHLDLDRPALERLFGHASVFWHAVGEGIDPEIEPERMEHFGIATVEAMSAGCVPVVIDRGGQREIVGGDPPVGMLWSDFDACLSATRALIGDPIRRATLAARARERALEFAYPRFAERVHHLFVGVPPTAATETHP